MCFQHNFSCSRDLWKEGVKSRARDVVRLGQILEEDGKASKSDAVGSLSPLQVLGGGTLSRHLPLRGKSWTAKLYWSFHKLITSIFSRDHKWALKA